jgi:hypothetical protein
MTRRRDCQRYAGRCSGARNCPGASIRQGSTMMGRPPLDAIPLRVKVGVESVKTFLKK